MRKIPPAYGRLLGAYLVLGLLLWTTPLLAVLHVESSAVVATAAYVGAGLSTRSFLRAGFSIRRIILLQEAALVVPWILLTVSAIWRPNCGYVQGLIFYVAFPVVTVVFAVGFMSFLHAIRPPRSGMLFLLVGIAIVLFGPIYDIGFHPQFYTYNHVFGGFLGPIYDDQITMRPGLFAFRLLTLLWSLFFLFSASQLEQKTSPYPAVIAAVALTICYAFAPKLGMVTTHAELQNTLGSLRQTAHFDIYYDGSVVSESALDDLAEDHEFRYDQFFKALRVSVDGRIRSYVYPDAETKARLTGARYTNVAPVWLGHPQTHVLYSAFGRVFAHELVHAFSRQFGLPWIQASVSVGLIEGLAVALEPPDGAPGPHEQVAAALLSAQSGTRAALSGSRDLSESLVSRLSPLGFWTGRGAVSYTAMGSFVAYLLDTYGADRFKRAYSWASFDEAYGKSVEVLAAEWESYLLSLNAVARSSEEFVSVRFQVPSLFEKDCPHYVPLYTQHYREATSALIRGDSLVAAVLLEEVVQNKPDFLPALELWAGIRIGQGDADDVLARIEADRRDTLSSLLLIRRGDALALLGHPDEAAMSYYTALDRLPSHAHETRSLVLLRLAASRRPSFLRAFLHGGVSRGEAADSSTSSVFRALLALRAARESRFEQALALMRTTSSTELASAVPILGAELKRRRLAWMARFAHRSGSLAPAAVFADSAAEAYRSVGAFNEAAVQDDLHERIKWLAAEEMAGMALSSARDGTPGIGPAESEE